jgi:hypothetical protein
MLVKAATGSVKNMVPNRLKITHPRLEYQRLEY